MRTYADIPNNDFDCPTLDYLSNSRLSVHMSKYLIETWMYSAHVRRYSQ